MCVCVRVIVCDYDIPCSSLIYPSSAVIHVRKISAGTLGRVLGAVHGRRKARERGRLRLKGGGNNNGVKPIMRVAERWEAICGRFQRSVVDGGVVRGLVYSVGRRSFVHVCTNIDQLFV